MQTTPGPSASAHPEPSRRPAERTSSAASRPSRLGRETGLVPTSARDSLGPGKPSSAPSGRAFTRPAGASGLRERRNRRNARPWVGRSYLHLVFPMPALDDDSLRLLDDTLGDLGWVVSSDQQTSPGEPVLTRRWTQGEHALVLIVLGWYPLLVTIGSEGRANGRVRQAERRLAETVVAAGGREVADRELEEAAHRCRERWPEALAARRVIEDHSRWLECRLCRACGAWSAYGALHCRGCARRFAPEDDAERDERGRAAAAATAEAEQRLAELGRGDGMFPDWPAVAPEPAGGTAGPPTEAGPPQAARSALPKGNV